MIDSKFSKHYLNNHVYAVEVGGKKYLEDRRDGILGK